MASSGTGSERQQDFRDQPQARAVRTIPPTAEQADSRGVLRLHHGPRQVPPGKGPQAEGAAAETARATADGRASSEQK